MDNNFNNETNDNNQINSGFESPSVDNPLNLDFEEPYIQATTSNSNLASVKPKKSRKWLVPTLAGLGVAIVACVCSVLFIPQVNNFFKMNTKSPTSYYKDIEKASIKDAIDEKGEQFKKTTAALSQFTGNLVAADDITNMYGMTADIAANTAACSGITITLNDEFKDYVKSYMSKENASAASTIALDTIDAFDSVKIDNLTMINDKQQLSTNLTFTLNGTAVISSNLIVDLKNYVVYISVPELTDTVFSIKIPQDVIDEFKKDFAADTEMLTTLFGQFDAGVKYLDENNEELTEFVEKYALIIVDSLEDAELTKKKEVDVNDITVEYTEIVVKIDEEIACTIAKNVMEELKDDEFAIGFASAVGVSKDEYATQIADLINEIESTDTSDSGSDETVDLYTYINNKGEIVGRGIGADNDIATYITYEKDDETQFQFTLEGKDESNPFYFIIKGKSTGEDSKSGKVVLEFNSEEDTFSFTCEFTNVSIANEELGYSSGIYAFTTTFPELEPFELILKLDANETTQKVTIDLLYNDMKTITLDFLVGQARFEEIKIPGNTFELKEQLDTQAVLTEMRKLNITKFKTNLKTALNSEPLNSFIDDFFTKYGLDVMDGDMTEEEVSKLIITFSELTQSQGNGDYEEEDDERTGDDGDPSMFMDYYNNGPY